MAAYRYFRDVRDHTLIRVDGGVPEVLWPSGTWHRYAEQDMLHDAMPITEEGAEALAGGADLKAPRSEDAPASTGTDPVDREE